MTLPALSGEASSLNETGIFLVLNGLNKRQVRMCAKELGASEKLWSKTSTADLEYNNPQLKDEYARGMTYDEIDDFLECKNINIDVERKISAQCSKTGHKREMPFGFGELI